jgi:hypothetical protein
MAAQLRGAEVTSLLRRVLQYQQALGGAVALQDNEARDLARVAASAEECAVAFLEAAAEEENAPAAATGAHAQQQQQQAAVDWARVLSVASEALKLARAAVDLGAARHESEAELARAQSRKWTRRGERRGGRRGERRGGRRGAREGEAQSSSDSEAEQGAEASPERGSVVSGAALTAVLAAAVGGAALVHGSGLLSDAEQAAHGVQEAQALRLGDGSLGINGDLTAVAAGTTGVFVARDAGSALEALALGGVVIDEAGPAARLAATPSLVLGLVKETEGALQRIELAYGAIEARRWEALRAWGVAGAGAAAALLQLARAWWAVDAARSFAAAQALAAAAAKRLPGSLADRLRRQQLAAAYALARLRVLGAALTLGGAGAVALALAALSRTRDRRRAAQVAAARASAARLVALIRDNRTRVAEARTGVAALAKQQRHELRADELRVDELRADELRADELRADSAKPQTAPPQVPVAPKAATLA